MVETVITGVGKAPAKAGDDTVGQTLLMPTIYRDEVISLLRFQLLFSKH